MDEPAPDQNAKLPLGCRALLWAPLVTMIFVMLLVLILYRK
jgi:hypothetical protein